MREDWSVGGRGERGRAVATVTREQMRALIVVRRKSGVANYGRGFAIFIQLVSPILRWEGVQHHPVTLALSYV